LIKRKPGFSGKMLWSLEIPFKTGFTVQFLLRSAMFHHASSHWIHSSYAATYYSSFHAFALFSLSFPYGWT